MTTLDRRYYTPQVWVWLPPLQAEAIRLSDMGLSAAAVARELGGGAITKNAVIGALWRAAERGEYLRPIDRRRAVATHQQPPTGFVPASNDPTGCRYPIGDFGRSWHWCNRPIRSPGESFCTEHHDLCYVKPPKE